MISEEEEEEELSLESSIVPFLDEENKDKKKFHRIGLDDKGIILFTAFHFSGGVAQSALSMFITPVISLMSLYRNHMGEGMGMVWVIASMVYIMACPLWSKLSDLKGHRTMGRRRLYIIIGTLITGISLVILSVFGQSTPITAFSLILVGIMIGMSATYTSWSSLLIEVVKQEKLGKIRFIKKIMTCLGYIVGSGVIPCVLDFIGIETVCIIMLALSIICNSLTLRMKEPTNYKPPPAFKLRYVISYYLDTLQEHKELKILFFIRVLMETTYSIFKFFTFFFIIDSISSYILFTSSYVSAGCAFILGGLATLVGTVFSHMYSKRWRTKTVLLISGGLQVVSCFTIVVFQTSHIIALISIIVYSFGYGICDSVLEVLVRRTIPSTAADDRSLGVYWATPHIANVVILIPAGAILDAFVRDEKTAMGYATLHFIMSSIMLIATLLITFLPENTPSLEPNENIEDNNNNV